MIRMCCGSPEVDGQRSVWTLCAAFGLAMAACSTGHHAGAFVPEGRNGHTFAVDVPFASVRSISVTASGNATARGSTCAAVAL